ncbi:MAG TPA: hypothetical protein VHH10_06555 [Rubrobacteraceae bacterium]|nr:hypothetical protein [Rubrobacteraceae bacterium]
MRSADSVEPPCGAPGGWARIASMTALVACGGKSPSLRTRSATSAERRAWSGASRNA